MDKRTRKLTHLGLDQAVAEKLVAAGLGTPKLIKAADDKALAAAGVKKSDVAAIKGG